MPWKFEAANILPLLEASSPDELDSCTFGVIRMGADGMVVDYSQYESRLSGLSPSKVRGRHFFREVAPCTNNVLVAQKFADSVELDQVIDYVFTFRMRSTRVRLRLLKSAAAYHQYLLVLGEA